MRGPKRAERDAQDFLGRRLAGAAGDGDDLGVRTRTGRDREIFKPALRIRDCKQRRGAGDVRRTMRHKGRAGAGFERRLHEIMAVAVLALERDEEIVLL